MNGPRRAGWLLALALATGGARAQAPAAPPAPAPQAAQPELPQACAQLAPEARDGAALALRAQCVLTGLLPSQRRWEQARELAGEALRAGEPRGGLMLYLAFSTDPRNSFMDEGKPDMEKYRALARRPLAERQEQVEAIEGLAFAAGRGNLTAMQLLAGYFYDVTAPRNVQRVRETAGLLQRNGVRTELNERMLREAAVVDDRAAQTKASLRVFFDAYRVATAEALKIRQGAGAPACDKATLLGVRSSDLLQAQYLPLKDRLVTDTYLVKGAWTEAWTFDACGQQVPVRLTFEADGWGGSTFTAALDQ